VAFFARQLPRELRLVGGYELLYPKVKTFLREQLFEQSPLRLEDPVVLRNLSEPEAGKLLFDHFKAAINALTVQDSGGHAHRRPHPPPRRAAFPHPAARLRGDEEIRAV
jgi:type III restriction enzyme